MKSGKITASLLVLALLVVGIFGVLKAQEAYAATTSTQGSTSSVTVNGLVSITLTNVPITFGSMDPGANYTIATSSDMNVQVDAVTNVPVNVYLNGTDFISGSYNFNVSNMHFQATAPGTGAANATCSGANNCSYMFTKNWIFNDTARLGSANSGTVKHWINIPSAQAPGTYGNNVRVCADQVGGSAC